MAKISNNDLGNNKQNSTCAKLRSVIVDIAHLQNKLLKATEIERKKELRERLKKHNPSPTSHINLAKQISET